MRRGLFRGIFSTSCRLAAAAIVSLSALCYSAAACLAADQACPTTVADFLKNAVPLQEQSEQDLLRDSSSSKIRCIPIASDEPKDIAYTMDLDKKSASDDDIYSTVTVFFVNRDGKYYPVYRSDNLKFTLFSSPVTAVFVSYPFARECPDANLVYYRNRRFIVVEGRDAAINASQPDTGMDLEFMRYAGNSEDGGRFVPAGVTFVLGKPCRLPLLAG